MTRPGLDRLRRYAGRPAAATPRAVSAPEVEKCDLCGVVVDARHGHLVDVDKRALVCACRPCYLLFTLPGAGGRRYRAIPDRYRFDPAGGLGEGDWEQLQIPVSPAFFFVNSALGRVVACYPSPAGATECELDLDAWARLAADRPLLGALEPDVEALYVTRAAEGIECFLVPIDACYSLVGALRLRWSGLDGGEEVRRTLAEFHDDLRGRARPIGSEN
jgi:hypothetical protein